MNSPKILIIEDSKAFSKVLESTLKNMNQHLVVSIVMNKEDALKHLEVEENRPDMIFLDTNIPGNNRSKPDAEIGYSLMKYFDKEGMNYTVITENNNKLTKLMSNAYNARAYLKKFNGSGAKEFKDKIRMILNNPEHDFVDLSIFS